MNYLLKNIIVVFSLAILISFPSFAEENAMTQSDVQSEFSQAQLEQMLAPIALYPDSLLTHLLIASTYPIEVVQAERWLDENSELESEQLIALSEDKDWDASVKALLPFPRVLKRLSENLDWTQQLGDAFLQDEAKVLASIQALRQKAEEAGNLADMENVAVSYEDDSIVIEPVHREIVYVPYYDTRVVYGNWHWSHHPPVYWGMSHRDLYYRPHHGLFSWHTGVHISFNFFFSAFHWSNHQVVVINRHQSRYAYSRGHVLNHHSAVRWGHNPSHRRGVAYRNNQIKARYHSNRPSYTHTKEARSFGSKSHANRALVNNAKVSTSRANHVSNSQIKRTISRDLKTDKHVRVTNKIRDNRVKTTYSTQQTSNRAKKTTSQSRLSRGVKSERKVNDVRNKNDGYKNKRDYAVVNADKAKSRTYNNSTNKTEKYNKVRVKNTRNVEKVRPTATKSTNRSSSRQKSTRSNSSKKSRNHNNADNRKRGH